MRETEITVQIFDNIENVKKQLELQGFKIVKPFIMHDYYYTSIESDLKNMKFKTIIGNSFLVRHLVNTINGEDITTNYLIYKNKIFNDLEDVVEEEKIQTKIENHLNAVKILELSGFKPYIINKSQNFVYKKGSIEFALQNVENLGVFIELEELEDMQNLTPEEKTSQLIQIIKTLGLKTGTDYNCKKLKMLLDKK